MLGLDGKEKPRFEEGERVLVSLPGGSRYGKVRGLISEFVIDFWIVEFENSPDPANYPWTCASIPHTMITKYVT